MSRALLVLCIVFLACGLAVAAYSAFLRVEADRGYQRVVVLVDWHELAGLPELETGLQPPPSGRTVPWSLLSALPGAHLCYAEETVGTLLTQGIFRPAAGTVAPSFVVTNSRYDADILAGASRHGYQVRRDSATGQLVVTVPYLADVDLQAIPVAWLGDVLAQARAHQVPVLLRPGGGQLLGADGARQTLAYAKRQKLMLFTGTAVLGYPGGLGQVASLMREQRMQFGWIEFDEQDGSEELAHLLNPQVVRVHSIAAEEMPDYDVDGAVARLLRAVRERDVRCLYLRPFIQGLAVGDTNSVGYRRRVCDVNRDYFSRLGTALHTAGYRLGSYAKPPSGPPQWLATWRPAAVALATGAALAFLALFWFPAWRPRSYWLILLLTVLAAAGSVLSGAAYALTMLATALVFPLLGLWIALWCYQRWVQPCSAWSLRRWLAALAALILASAVSAAGGLLIHGGMWDAASMLRVTQFRGVTVALALPVLLLAAYAWQAETLQDAFNRASWRLAGYWERFLGLWSSPIRYGDVAFIFIALGALGIVLLRSGNESPLGILSLETWFRGGLESVFSVRPRTKELLGHPLLVAFLLSLAWRNRISLLFGLAALLGQVSILNTFCHLHTPLLLTVHRTALGLGLGIISGGVAGGAMVIGTHIAAALSRPEGTTAPAPGLPGLGA
jgi:hypothetical protein